MKTSDDYTEIWPISPTFISLRKDAYKGIPYTDENGDRHIYSPNEDGIFSSDELRGFLADASDDQDINNPISLFQIIPEDFTYNCEDGRIKELFPSDVYITNILSRRRIIRIDPGKLYSNFQCCDIFRKCNIPKHERLCFESDSRIALLYDERLSCINYNAEFDLFYSTLSKVIQEYNEYIEWSYPLSVVKYNNNRLYVKYQCKYSKLYEFFFPIIHNGKVIAVLMQGQRFHKDLKRDDIFKDYLETHNNCRKLKSSIQNLGHKKFQEDAMSEKRLLSITNRINIIEKRISVEMDAAAQWYVNECFYFWSREFRSQIRKIDTQSKEALDDYKKILNETLNKITQTFNKDGFIRIYSMIYSIEDENKTRDLFELIGDSSNLNNVAYSWLEFKSLSLTSYAIEKEDLLKYLKRIPANFNISKDIFRLEAPFDSKKAYIIWKRYNNIVYDNHFEMYCDALKSMYNTLLESYFI